MIPLLLACTVEVDTPTAPRRDPFAAWGARLAEVVTPEGRVDYAALRADEGALRAFVGWVGAHGPESDHFKLLDDDRRLAWHINAYNALVLWGVLRHWPIESVQDVPGPFGAGSGFFWKLRFLVDGERRSLHGYEQATILALYQEPAAHAALVCAARSCPPLRAELYRADTLAEQLRDQMTRWVNGGAVRVVAQPDGAPTFEFSAIFDWYAEDFRAWAGVETPCEAALPYAEGELATALRASPDCPAAFAPYDWSLNRP